MKRNLILTPEQKAKFERVIQENKFNRLVNDLLSERKISAEEKSRLILKLKQKMFGK